MRIPWTDHVHNKEVLRKMKAKIKTIYNQNEKETIEFSGEHNEEKGFEEFDTEYIEIRRDKRMAQVTYLTTLCKWNTEQRMEERVKHCLKL